MMSYDLKIPTPTFALLGSGRLARHLQFYFNQLNLKTLLWARNGELEFNSSRHAEPARRLHEVVGQSTHILLAVSDSAISKLSESFRNRDKMLVHFSGALQVPGVHAAHPLMTFGTQIESLSWYRAIPFVLDAGDTFATILPGLPNPSCALEPAQRAYYHALCSLAGNSSYLLWQKIGDEFEQRLGLPRHLLQPYLHQVVTNAGHSSGGQITGPVARQDWSTVRRHLETLKQQPELYSVYQSYLGLAHAAGHPIPEAML